MGGIDVLLKNNKFHHILCRYTHTHTQTHTHIYMYIYTNLYHGTDTYIHRQIDTSRYVAALFNLKTFLRMDERCRRSSIDENSATLIPQSCSRTQSLVGKYVICNGEKLAGSGYI